MWPGWPGWLIAGWLGDLMWSTRRPRSSRVASGPCPTSGAATEESRSGSGRGGLMLRSQEKVLFRTPPIPRSRPANRRSILRTIVPDDEPGFSHNHVTKWCERRAEAMSKGCTPKGTGLATPSAPSPAAVGQSKSSQQGMLGALPNQAGHTGLRVSALQLDRRGRRLRGRLVREDEPAAVSIRSNS